MFSFLTRHFLWALPTIMIAIVSMLLLFPLRKRNLKKKGMSTTSLHEFGFILLVAYSAILFSLTLNLDQIWVSLYYGWPLPKTSFFSGYLNFWIFNELSTTRDLWMLLGNVFLFFPFGFLLSLLWAQPKWWRLCLLGTLFSFCIESIQFIIVGRWFDSTDILMNTFGTFLGWLVWRMLFIIFSSFTQRFRCIKKNM